MPTAALSEPDQLLQQMLEDCKRYLDNNNLVGALRALNHAIGVAPENAELLAYRGGLLLRRGEVDSARKDFSDALKLNPQFAPAYSGMAQMYLDSGNVIEAEFNAHRALGLDPNDEAAAAILQSLKSQTKNATVTRAGSPVQVNWGANHALENNAAPEPSDAAAAARPDSTGLDSGLTLELGAHSYIHDSKIRNPSGALTHIRIGKFCSIATDLTIIGYDHHHEWITTYPFLDDPNRAVWKGTEGIPYPQAPEFGSNKSRGDIVVGNDVWIGYGVKLFKGVTIGNGAVIGACSLVNKSVEPYTIVAGTPARPIRKRFSESGIAFLEKIQWWNWPVELINRWLPYLCSSKFSELAKRLEADPDFWRFETGTARQEMTPQIGTAGTTAFSVNRATDGGSPNGKTVRTPAAAASQKARQGVWNFLKTGCDFFSGVKPPLLSEIHLQNSRVVPRRKDILALMPKDGVCAEIGTQTGNFAKQILRTMRPAKLHIYDVDFTPFDHAYFQAALEQGVVELHQGDSAASLAKTPDQHFDFIYIDGDHSYEGAVRDLEEAARKIKADGWIVCNDYTIYSPLEKAQYGVYRAVNEFCWNHGFEIIYLGLHQWSYHDVALRRMKPEDSAAAAASRRHVRARPASSATPNGTTREHSRQSSRTVAPQVNAGRIEDIDAPCIIQTIGQGDEMFTGDKDHYFGVGKSALKGIESALLAAGKPRNSIRRILDLPCGHGRVMRFFKAAFPQAQITACDLNRGAVDFCAQTFAAQPVYSNVDVNQIPLSGKYDLIWSGSLLTHLRADACAEFVRLFSRLLDPGGVAVFTLHGRWVERSLATNRYTYGLNNTDVTELLKEYYATGFGYADYPGAAGYGISVSSPAYVLANLVSQPDLKLISYHEKGWDNHQDIVCLQKLASHEPMG